MGERRGDQPPHGHLPQPARPGPGECDLALQPADHIGDGGIVGRGDLVRNISRRERPQRGHRFHR